jgi:hypothetical protein
MDRIYGGFDQNSNQKDGWILIESLAGKSIRAIYKTVSQIKTKHGQVREQDRVRLNNRVEQKLIECRENGILGDNGRWLFF